MKLIPNFIPGYYPFSLSKHEIDPKHFIWLLSTFFKYAWNWSQTLYLVIIDFFQVHMKLSTNIIPGYYPFTLHTHEIDTKHYIIPDYYRLSEIAPNHKYADINPIRTYQWQYF